MHKKNFNEIIHSVSVNDLTEPSSSETIKLSIALFARFIVKAHVGWDEFPDKLKHKFSSKIEHLYHNPPQNNQELEKAMEIILLRCIPDNHCSILNASFQKVLSEDEVRLITDTVSDKYPQMHVGQNTVFTLQDSPEYNILSLRKKGKEAIGIFEKNENGEKIGIISLSCCPQPNDLGCNLKDFIQTFENNMKNWDYVILDVRGNRGGNSFIISEISNRLYGNTVGFCSSQSLRMTPEAKYLHKIKFSNPQDTKKLYEIYSQIKTPYYVMPCKEETQFNAQKGFNKPVYIITDRRTSSSAEYVCGLYKHPKVKFIGENTCGCGEFGDTVHLRLPCGSILQMGVWRYNIRCRIKEGIGWSPTHPTTREKDAFFECLEMIKKDYENTKRSCVTEKLLNSHQQTQPNPSQDNVIKLRCARRCKQEKSR